MQKITNFDKKLKKNKIAASFDKETDTVILSEKKRRINELDEIENFDESINLSSKQISEHVRLLKISLKEDNLDERIKDLRKQRKNIEDDINFFEKELLPLVKNIEAENKPEEVEPDEEKQKDEKTE